MFTGLIQGVGVVVSSGSRFVLQLSGAPWGGDFELGESIAVNGCCLTLVSTLGGSLGFDLSEETLWRTTLGRLVGDDQVNLERALSVGDRLGGHFVQGHVDAVGAVVAITPVDGASIYRFRVPDDRYLIDKGSIALDGISLTVVSPLEGKFDTWIVPHTLASTNLASLRPGDPVNVEYDVLAKYVEKLTQFALPDER